MLRFLDRNQHGTDRRFAEYTVLLQTAADRKLVDRMFLHHTAVDRMLVDRILVYIDHYSLGNHTAGLRLVDRMPAAAHELPDHN